MSEIDLMHLYPKTKRDVEERGKLVTEEHRVVARQFGKEFFDGDRLYGYGGYNYHPRFWRDTVRLFDAWYQRPTSVLDVGCAKGFMLQDFRKLDSSISIAGIDISKYAIELAARTIKRYLQVGNARELPYEDDSFDLAISINTIHNLPLEGCKQALREIERVSRKNSFIMVDAWRNEGERENLMKWNLTAQTYMHVDDWKELFNEVGYTGDYYWFIAE